MVAGSFDDVVCLEVTPKGISVNSVDKAQSSYLDAYFDSHGSNSIFRNFKCAKPYLLLYLHPKILSKLLKATAGSTNLLSTMQLEVGEAEDRLTVRINSLSKLGISQTASYHISLLDATTDFEKVTVDGSAFHYTAEAMTSTPAILSDVISQLKACGCQEVQLSISEDRMAFASMGAELPTQCELVLARHLEEGKLCLAAAEPTSSCKYAFKFFERIGKLAAVSTRLLLQMAGADAPLSVIADLTGGGFVHIFIAPLTDIEEDG
ncbi:hypothetical protein N2152v2_011045 [Parachlorella kessleri]